MEIISEINVLNCNITNYMMFTLNILQKNFLHRVLREIENIRHDASLLKEQMTLVKEDIRVVKMMISLLVIFLTFSYLTIINFYFSL